MKFEYSSKNTRNCSLIEMDLSDDWNCIPMGRNRFDDWTSVAVTQKRNDLNLRGNVYERRHIEFCLRLP